jgi:undecaprenyl diphosphate synthase
MEKIIDGEKLNVPEHVAIILDGNGRWAQKRLMPRNYGHIQGAKTVEEMCEIAWNLGIKYFTVYAFSTENWKRPQSEVDALMKLLRKYLVDSLERTAKNNMRVRVIGDKTGLSDDIRATIENLEKATTDNTGLNFTIAINYGSRDEMIRAMKKMMKDGHTDAEELTEELFASYLDTAGVPDPDLVIRTSGEQRVSNFLLWQLAYSEFYFTPVLWPDYNRQTMVEAIREYTKRDRRFGGV